MIHLKVVVHLHQLGTLLSLHLDLLGSGHHKVVAVNTLQHASGLLAVGIQHLHLFANEVQVLLRHLKGLSKTGRTYPQLLVFLVTAQPVFDIPAQRHAVLYPHTVGVVYLHHDTAILANLYVDKEIVLVLQPFFYQAFYDIFVYHTE